MSATQITAIRCDGCGDVTHVPKVDPDQARRWASSWCDHVSFVGADGVVRDLCCVCQRPCTFVDQQLVHARDEVLARRVAAQGVLGGPEVGPGHPRVGAAA